MAVINLEGENLYPIIKRIAITTAAQEIIIPKPAVFVSFGSESCALYYANVGNDGDSFNVDITDYDFVPVGNKNELKMEKGIGSNRKLLIGTKTGSGYLSLVIEKI